MRLLILFVVITGILVILASIFIGIRTFEGTVIGDAYHEGLGWDETQERLKRFEVEIRNRRFRRGDNRILLDIKRDGLPYNEEDLKLLITRPSTDQYDREVEARRIGEGLYRAEVSFPVYGQWQIIIKTRDVMIKEGIFVEKGGMR